MAEDPPALTSVRFGRFELLVDAGELRKDGVRLKLSGQPIQVLARLVAEPGQLVTREELQEQLWPGSSYGDFEKGLNAAVNRLRESLGDSATEPKYIETIPRRGYRFIGELEPGTTLGPQPAELDVAVPTKSKGLRSLVIAATLAVAVVASATYFYFRRPAKFMEKDTLVIADFDNKTGDAVFDDTLKTGLTVALNQSPFLNVLSDRRVMETLKLMTLPSGAKLTPDVVRELCLRAGQQGLHCRIHREPGQRVRARAENGELPERRNAGAAASNRKWQAKGTECVE